MLCQWCQVMSTWLYETFAYVDHVDHDADGGVREITTLDELRAATRPWMALGDPPMVRVALPGMSEVRTVALQAAIERYGRACGCRAGKVGVTAAAALLAVAALKEPSLYNAGLVPVAGAVLAVLAAGAVIGKVTGLLRAHAQLRRTVRAIMA